MSDILLSYVAEDTEIADQLAEAFRLSGIFVAAAHAAQRAPGLAGR